MWFGLMGDEGVSWRAADTLANAIRNLALITIH